MKSINIYFKRKYAFALSENELQGFLSKNLIVLNKDSYELNKNCKELNYLFMNSIPDFKKFNYFKEMRKVDFKCQVCGKPQSLHVSPKIENDIVNFKEIIVVCKHCRQEKLKRKNIVKPVFEKRYSYKKEKILLKESILKNDIQNIKEYSNLFVKIERIKWILKVCLPPLKTDNLDDYYIKRESFRKKYGDDIDLSNHENRTSVRAFLTEENRGYCPFCGKKKNMTIEHMTPKSLGGLNSIINFIGLCYDCNQEKGSLSVLEFLSIKEIKRMSPAFLEKAHEQKSELSKILNKLQIELELIK